MTRDPGRPVDYEDVDDVIGVASEIMEAGRDQISAEDMRAVGADLDIPPDVIDKAVAELERRRAAAAREAAAARRRRRVVGAVAAGVAGLLLVIALAGQAGLSSALSDVEARRAQVVNVMERREATRARFEPAPASPERDAELSGADNRVHIERKRYDEAAAAYNARAAGFPGSLWSALFGLPERVPLSSEVERW